MHRVYGWGLYQSKVTSSLAAIQRPGHQTDHCKMACWLAELGGPGDPASPYRKAWVDFVMVIMASGDGEDDDNDRYSDDNRVVQDSGHTRANRLTETCSLVFIASFFDIGHPCYGQLTPIKTKYLLTSITWLFCRLTFEAHWGWMFFEIDRWQCAVFDWIMGSFQVNLLSTGPGCLEAC